MGYDYDFDGFIDVSMVPIMFHGWTAPRIPYG